VHYLQCLMDISTGNSLLRIAWIAAGFSTESRKYAIKLLLQDGELTTLFTDYRELFLEQIRLNDRFSELNAKLSAPDDVLVAKLEELFASSSSKCELTAERENMIVKLESTKGKRIFRWRFEGHLIDDGHQLFFDHVVRPLLDMLSMAANLHRLEFLKESSKPVELKEAFAFPQVRKLYEVTASCLKYSKSELDVDNSSLPPTPEPVLRKRSPSASCESNSSGSMPSTPPPADTKQSDATENVWVMLQKEWMLVHQRSRQRRKRIV
uniref:Uncharacterized protein n=1 Tax=Parascaris univalens TaxID=6257 RepID=A0A915BKA4_PARUN